MTASSFLYNKQKQEVSSFIIINKKPCLIHMELFSASHHSSFLDKLNYTKEKVPLSLVVLKNSKSFLFLSSLWLFSLWSSPSNLNFATMQDLDETCSFFWIQPSLAMKCISLDCIASCEKDNIYWLCLCTRNYLKAKIRLDFLFHGTNG